MTANIKYEALSSDASSETSDAAVAQFKSNFQRRKHFNVLSFSTGCLTTIVVVAVTIFVHRILLAPKTAEQLEAEDWNDCGRSVDVARARGCVMEPMFYGFMPSRCVFPELSNQFPVFEDRPYYSDENMTQLVTPEELWNGKYSVVYTAKYHDQHCLYQWRKLHYAMTHKVDYLDNKTMSIGHATHCADQMTQKCEPATGNRNFVVLGFFKCRKTIW